jgi:hypothetical protein
VRNRDRGRASIRPVLQTRWRLYERYQIQRKGISISNNIPKDVGVSVGRKRARGRASG